MFAAIIPLVVGIGAGFVVAWARLSDPSVIRDMLLLRDPHVFLVMGSAVMVAAIGQRFLRALRLRAVITGEPIAWSVERPQGKHIAGSLLFGVGWSVAGTCPGPVAAMLGQGHLDVLPVVAGLLAGVALQHRWRPR
jgi:uncharacterized membrane protein YedE/YeeE